MTRSRTQQCGEPQTRQRLARAQSFLEMAEMAADESDPSLEYGAAAASIAILAGIAEDTAHYGFITPTPPELKQSLRQAEQLVGFAERVVKS